MPGLNVGEYLWFCPEPEVLGHAVCSPLLVPVLWVTSVFIAWGHSTEFQDENFEWRLRCTGLCSTQPRGAVKEACSTSNTGSRRVSENKDSEPSLSGPGGTQPASLRISSWFFSPWRWGNNADFWSPPQVYLIRAQQLYLWIALAGALQAVPAG